MTTIPNELRYTKDHEWLRLEGDQAIIGLTDYAQRQLGDCVFAELPKIGETYDAGEPFGSVESVKAVSEIYMPVAGTVTATNDTLQSDPEQINEDPYGDGWLAQITMADPSATGGLLSASEYQDYIAEEAAE
ncbi:glycine cleavage system protein GcvH [Nocardia sp. NPDC127526]|uniref:glycine cleavage system protein GcvH n=1 Tax=Nocardia sp. NPDC127526 TaxID=3345393 RepID=UPI00362F8D57